ncbi:MAG: S-methyl-5-thioribose-1-phosphate isomerase [Deltaproteobacteria bacterium]|nr:S-methyl-5-thioribose-1-phosphate isomerase [Deltaproteobacteria bacterium]
MGVEPIRWKEGRLSLLDQRLLPWEERWIACRTPEEVAEAIRTLAVRGAPAIGVAAAFGLASAARDLPAAPEGFREGFRRVADLLASTRPTAVNLFWAIDRMQRRALAVEGHSRDERERALDAEAEAIRDGDLESCRAIGRFGGPLVRDGEGILTHCNAGALATAGYGTALGVIRAAHEAGTRMRVFARETRPLLQGARLTTWELLREGIEVTLVTDSMAAHLMARGMVHRVVVGADRIASNGDTANKIGTYGLAIVAHHHGVPFHVAAPLSTLDPTLADGRGIPIEERDPSEVTTFAGRAVAAPGVRVFNPAFDVTPSGLITSIVTDRGVAEPPFRESLQRLAAEA